LILGTFVGFGVEGIGARPNVREIKGSIANKIRASSSLALILISLLCLNWVAFKKDMVIDLSYLKLTKASESTKNLVSKLQSPLIIGASFSKSSTVLPYLKEYFEGLDSKNLQIDYFDKDFSPTMAEKYFISDNGDVVLAWEGKQTRFQIGDNIDTAKKNLRVLDSLFREQLIKVTSVKTAIYFTVNHGELTWAKGTSGGVDKLGLMETALLKQNVSLRPIDNLYLGVPADAKVVAIMGPSTAFNDVEIDALREFVEKGGRVLVALGKNTDDRLLNFLGDFNIQYNDTTLVHDEKFLSSNKEKSDRAYLVTTNFVNHPILKSFNRVLPKASLLLYQSGSFDLERKNNLWSSLGIVYSERGGFRDANSNFEADPDEKRATFPVYAVAESNTNGRLIAIANAAMFSDALIRNEGNKLLLLDTINWLTGKTEFSGTTGTEEDVLIRHDNQKDLAIFHGSIYLIPSLLIAVGFFVNRKLRNAA
ncbi:MAG: hypothetical protein EOP04_13250, partial [Proteobacteria bacterium]